ncbi:adenosylcobinamide kinase/adenosylcobinamide phosphate guanyltransferase [Heyndrickxia sporothermodurans]|nr:adenosylcobinamide kinase/adenosylcobinamide phosphate guanyltransferase [Heyndrickxia sporothermodurans]
MEKSKMIFISGGVRSGKSSFAEQLAIKYARQMNGRLNYLACGRATDREMTDRISHHKETRKNSELPWVNWECPVNVKTMSPFYQSGDIVLLDCLTTLLNNELFQDEDSWERTDFQKNVVESILTGIEEIRKNCSVFIIVSNEVLNEQLHKGAVVFTYAKLLGLLHQNLVQESTVAYLVESGIPLLMKERSQ